MSENTTTTARTLANSEIKLYPFGELILAGGAVTAAAFKRYGVSESVEHMRKLSDTVYSTASVLATAREQGASNNEIRNLSKKLRNALHHWFIAVGTKPNPDPKKDDRVPCFCPTDADLVIIGELAADARRGDPDLTRISARFLALLTTETLLLLTNDERKRGITAADIKAARDAAQKAITEKANRTRKENEEKKKNDLTKKEEEGKNPEPAKDAPVRSVDGTAIALTTGQLSDLIAALVKDIDRLDPSAEVKARLTQFTMEAAPLLTAIKISL